MTMLKKGISQISAISDKSFLDDTSLLESSLGLKRLTRKTDQSTASRRSLSRRSSSKSEEKSDIDCFFIKMSSLNMPLDNSSISTRSNALLRDDSNRQKKRSPTPLPGHLMRRRQKEREKERKDLDIQGQLKLVELQTKYNMERDKVKAFERRVEQLERQIKFKIKKIEQFSVLLVKSEQRQKEMADKLKRSQDIAIENESSLTQTKSKLEKLKNTIKINRYSQLEVDNGKLRKDKQKMENKIKQLEAQNKETKQRCLFLEKELFALKRKMELPRGASAGKGQKGQSMASMLKARDQYAQKLQEKIAKLEIKLNFMNRKKLEEIEKFKEKKDAEMHNLRTKMAYVNSELRIMKIQNQKLKERSIDTSSATLIPLERKNSFLSNNAPSKHQQIFCLSLSPEHNQA